MLVVLKLGLATGVATLCFEQIPKPFLYNVMQL